jgi:hypothetical protein
MVLAEAKRPKLSRRKRARAKKTLEHVFDTVVTNIETDPFLRNHLFLKRADKNRICIGPYTILKNSLNMFDIMKHNEQLYTNLYVFDAAIAIVESLNSDRQRFLPIIIEAEEEYARNVDEMRFFKHMINANTENKSVFEDRYQEVKDRAAHALERIKKFRLVK